MKDNSEVASLRKGKTPQASKVTDAKEAPKGTAAKLADANDNGNPKHRTQSVSGGPTIKGRK